MFIYGTILLLNFGGIVVKISVIGAGYVGLVTATCLADLGNDVICVDKNQEKLTMLKAHQPPFLNLVYLKEWNVLV